MNRENSMVIALLLLAQSISVGGDVPNPLKLDAAALQAMPRASLAVKEGERERKYEGVWLHEVLRAAGAPVGEGARGTAMAAYIRTEASDGYQAVFSMAEVNPLLQDSPILLADRVDGAPLDAKHGPFRLVVPRDKRPARWIRMLQKIEVHQVWK